jgi:protoporphyrinogen oxidase
MNQQFDVVIVGAGFTGLAAGLELARIGHKVLILESEPVPGGLAGAFEFQDGVRVEKFYHHWFNNDAYVPKLARELGIEDQIVTRPSRTGIFYSGRRWRLSTPYDVLRFRPLSFVDRVKLGLLVLQARRVKDWRSIEHLSIQEWLEPLCGPNVFRVVWKPLIEHKFSIFSDQVNAVWMWKKLALRGSTRDSKGGEQLAYFKGGFGRLIQAMADRICDFGGEIHYSTPVTGARVRDDEIVSLFVPSGDVSGHQFLFTPSFSIIADIFEDIAPEAWLQTLRRVKYLGNVCLLLELDRSLSDTYWLNVNDPDFPFVGVIEHTNFDDPKNYNGQHIVFLSRYLTKEDPIWNYEDSEYFEFALKQLRRIFPVMQRSWVKEYRTWRAEFAQPITERSYSQYVPGNNTPYTNGWISTMAQVYPEDRGTNYAIREGWSAAKNISKLLVE